MDLTLPIEPAWKTLREDLHPLTAFAVEYRYPGEFANEGEAKEAVEACTKLRRFVRAALGLDPGDAEEIEESRDEK